MISTYGISKIALLTDGVHPLVLGGMQKHSFHLLRALLERNIQVVLYHPSSKKGEIKDHIPERLHILLKEVRIPFDKNMGIPGSYLRKSFAYSARIGEHLKTGAGIDFIYAQGFTAWALLDQKRKGKSYPPVGVNFHGLEMFQAAKGLKQKLIQWMFRGPVKFNLQHADRVYSLGGDLTRILKDIVPSERIAEIPIALEEDWLLKGEKVFRPERLRVLFIGRYERRKGIEELNACISGSDLKGLEYHFVGPIPMGKRVDHPAVTYHGKIMALVPLMEIIDTCDLLIVPSYAEGMPTVILEAMARGLIVLASNVGAVSVLVDERNGAMMRPGSIADIAEGLSYIQGLDDAEKMAMSQHALQKVKENFTWSIVIGSMLEDMRDVMQNSESRC